MGTRYEFKPRPYNGNGWVDQYLAQFKYGAESACWPREEWGLRLITALEGKALRVITESRLPPGEKPTFEAVSKLLQETFAPDASRDVWLTTLEQRRRQKYEKLTELSQAILDLVARSFPGTAMEERDRIAVGYFARAMGPALRQHTLASRPKCLAEAVQTALAFENATRLEDLEVQNKADRSVKVRAMMADPEDDVQPAEVAEASAVFVTQAGDKGHSDRHADASHQSPQSTGRIICQLCGKIGHGAKDCWTGSRPTSVGRRENHNVNSRSQKSRAELEAEDRMDRLQHDLQLMNAHVYQLATKQQNVSSPVQVTSGARVPVMPELPPRLPGSCYLCGAMDHWANACPQSQNQGRGRGKGRGRRGNGAGRGGYGQPLGPSQQ